MWSSLHRHDHYFLLVLTTGEGVHECDFRPHALAPHTVYAMRPGRFTGEAQKEANRDGVPPIELIDGERLVSLFEKYELGLKPKTVYELVPEFFRSFES